MIKKLKSKIQSTQKGANLVEFALVLFILLLMLTAIADLGRAFHYYSAITNASREGARLGARVEHTPLIDGFIRDAVINEAANSNIDLTDVNVATITIEPVLGEVERLEGEPITVTVEYTLSMMLGGFVGIQELPIRSQTVMMMYGSEPVGQ